MSQNPAELTGRQQRAVVLVVEDRLTNEEIAERIGVARRTIERWKNQLGFQAAVKDHKRALETDLSRFDIAVKSKRMAAINNRWQRASDLIDARAEEHKEAPGGKTGLLVHQIKVHGQGKGQIVVDEYAADTALMAEMRQMEKQAAQEAGQWAEKSEITGDVVIRRTVIEQVDGASS